MQGRGLPADLQRDVVNLMISLVPALLPPLHPFSARRPQHPRTRETSFPHCMLCSGDTFPAETESRSQGRALAARSLPEAVQSCEHHVCGVQGVDEVGWEGILLLHCIRLPAAQSGRQEEVGHFQGQR